MPLIDSIDSFYNLIGFVCLTAPDRFPVRDYLAPEEQWSLDRAFRELRHGLQYLDPKVADQTKLARLSALLEASESAYRNGDRTNGIKHLRELESLVFKV